MNKAKVETEREERAGDGKEERKRGKDGRVIK